MPNDNPPQLDNLFDPIKRGGIRCVKCRVCGLEFFEADVEHTEAHDRGHCRTATNTIGR